jgi:hypothetical protein
MSLANLKKGSSLDKLKKAVEASSKTGGGGNDDRYWQPEVDAAGNGYAVIRFLDTPAVDGEDGLPWVQMWSHGFQGPGGWYIENSLTTLGKTDPVSEYNTKLWNSGLESDKKIARDQKRKLAYISNILVVSDPKRPQNEGKVFLFKYGKKVFDKIKEKLEPQFEDEKPLNVFDFWKGAKFKLKIRKVEGYRNYDKCEFENPEPLFNGDDEKIEKVWKSAQSLKGEVAPDKFKSYDELKAKLDKALGNTVKKQNPIADEETPPPSNLRSAPAKSTASEATIDDSDDMAFFEQLAGE